MQTIELYDLGQLPYKPVWDLQRAIQQRLIRQKKARRNVAEEHTEAGDTFNDVLLFVEHPHVYTLGKSGDSSHLLKDHSALSEIKANYIEIDRGGDITYHGPGQIVGYPILDLDRHFTDIHKYLRLLEEVIIRTCAEFDIEAGRIEGYTGVWVGNRKICAMGIRCSRWVTMHGFALNANTDLSYFKHIVPCGITGKEVTSIEKILGHTVSEETVKGYLATHFENVFGVRIIKNCTLTELECEFSYLGMSSADVVSR